MSIMLEVKDNLKVEEIRISSREVAEMLEMSSKDGHRDLIRKIENLAKKVDSEKVPIESLWIENTFTSRGKSYREYLVSKKGCELLAHKSTGSKGVAFTIAYMDKFIEMENKLKSIAIGDRTEYRLPNTFKEALMMLVEAEEEKEKLLLESNNKSKALEIAAPKIELYDNFMSSEDLYTVKDIAKCFGLPNMGRNNFYSYLREKKILIDGTYESYQCHIDRGLCKQIIVKYTLKNKKTCQDSVCKFTAKGVEFLYKKLKRDGFAFKDSFDTIANSLIEYSK